MQIIGTISRLFYGVDFSSMSNEQIESMLLGKPIKNDTGNEIGVITKVIPECDIYCGLLDDTASIYDVAPSHLSIVKE